jgi:RNA polymerase sigma-70 factor, ECF subfamily
MQQFESIYEQHLEAVRAYVKRRAPADLVDDVVSETFLVCFRRIDDIPREPLPWLYGVARKLLANERRRRARTAPADSDLTWEPDPVGDGALAAAFAALSERDREVLRLVAWEGLTLGEAAEVLGCSALACRVRYHRAKTRLAARLDAAASFRPEPEGAMR